MICITDIINGLALDCLNIPFAGLVQDGYVTNYNDIDRDATTFNTSKTDITALTLLTGKKFYKISASKKLLKASAELAKKEITIDKFKHVLESVAYDLDESTKTFLQSLASGARITAIIERKFKGAGNTTGFQVLGYDAGMEITEAKWDSGEQDGIIPFKLGTVDGEEEVRLPYTYLATDYATTKAAITAML